MKVITTTLRQAAATKLSWEIFIHHRRGVVCDTRAAWFDVRLNSIPSYSLQPPSSQFMKFQTSLMHYSCLLAAIKASASSTHGATVQWWYSCAWVGTSVVCKTFLRCHASFASFFSTCTRTPKVITTTTTTRRSSNNSLGEFHIQRPSAVGDTGAASCDAHLNSSTTSN